MLYQADDASSEPGHAFLWGRSENAVSQSVLGDRCDPPDEHTVLLSCAIPLQKSRFLRPSPWWYIILNFCIATTSGFSTAPMLGLLNEVICEDYKNSGTLPTEPSLDCSTDPRVQSGVSAIIATQSAIMGILSCLTAAWWGSLSDRRGRTGVIALCGLPYIDGAYLLVWLYRDAMPLGYRFVILGYAVQGLAGGMSSLASIMQAYITDCTEDSSRARAFSLFLGALYAGSAIGPSLGSLLVRLTGNTASVFFVSTSVCACTSACSWLLVPESVPAAAMMDARRRHADAKAATATGWMQTVAGAIAGFVRPLGVLLPDRGGHGQGRWNLVLLAGAYGAFSMISTSSHYVLQYAGARLHFSVEMMGYAVSIAGASRALYLTLCFPVVVRVLGRMYTAPEALNIAYTDARAVPRAFALNLTLARASAAFEAAVFAVFPLVSRPAAFMAAMGAGAAGAGFNPSVQSLAVEVYASRGGARETGKLFGALSVVQALCGHMLGPTLFGVICMHTFATAPASLFIVATAFTTLSFLSLGFVRELQPYTTAEDDTGS